MECLEHYPPENSRIPLFLTDSNFKENFFPKLTKTKNKKGHVLMENFYLIENLNK